MSGTATVTYQDSESIIKYSDGWTPSTWQAFTGESGDFHFANDFSTFFTFTFPVPALGVEYWGFRRSKGGLYQVCLDCSGADGDPAWRNIDALNITDDGLQPPVMLWSINFTQPETHTVIIHNRDDTRFGASQITLDRMVMIVPSAPLASTTRAGASTSSAPPSGTQTSSGISTSAGSGMQGSLKTSKSTPVGAIAGGVVGGVVGAIAIGILIWWLLRRKSGQSRSADPAPIFTEPPVIPQHYIAPYAVPNGSTQALVVPQAQLPMQQYSNVSSAYPPSQQPMSIAVPSNYTYSNSAPSESEFAQTSPAESTAAAFIHSNTPADRKNPRLYTEGQTGGSSTRSPDVPSPLSPLEEMDAGPAPSQLSAHERTRNPPSYDTVFTNRNAPPT